MRRLKILAVCGMGLGSSVILRIQAEKAVKALGLEADVESADIASAGAQSAGVDVIVTSAALAGQLAHTRARVVTIQNYMSLAEMTEKLKAALG
jgi:PTS system ascorbate-specific IIB component